MIQIRTHVFDPSDYKAHRVSPKDFKNTLRLETQLRYQIDNLYMLTHFEERCSNFEAG